MANHSSSARVTLRSPAKINLFLRILGKRPDNFHEIATLIQAIDLFDYLTFEKADQDSFTCSDTSLPTDASNLVIKARNLFRSKTGINIPLHIHLEKHIPSQAGLGGGSGNAATTLYACNLLANAPLNENELTDLAAEIGSDIAFFFSTGAAYCTGRGERITSTAIPKSEWTLYKPATGLSTPAVYKALDLNKTSKACPEELLNKFQEGQFTFINDLEEPALTLLPSLKFFKEDLEKCGYSAVKMTGSGSAFFCTGSGKKGDGSLGTFNSVNREAPHWW